MLVYSLRFKLLRERQVLLMHAGAGLLMLHVLKGFVELGGFAGGVARSAMGKRMV